MGREYLKSIYASPRLGDMKHSITGGVPEVVIGSPAKDYLFTPGMRMSLWIR